MGTCENFDSPNKSRLRGEQENPVGGSGTGMLVRFRLRLQHRMARRFIVRSGLAAKPASAGSLEWLAQRMRIRIPAQSYRSAAAMIVVAVLVGPVTLTLVAGHKAGVALSLEKIERFTLPLTQASAPRQAALPGTPPQIQPAAGEALTAGNIPSERSGGFLESIKAAVAGEFSGQPRGTSTASLTPAEGESGRNAAASAWPEPSPGRVDQKLRDAYMWRAWMEKAVEFHARRSHGQSLLVYHPGEGYAVMSAAYYPIQPVQREEPEEERSIYQDRRQPRSSPDPAFSEETPSEITPPDNRPPVIKPRRSTSSRLGALGNALQPWDSEIMSDPIGPVNGLVSRIPGLRIDRVVLFQGFSTNGYPMESGRLPFFNQNLGYDIDVGALATISWTRARPTSGLYMVYTPSRIQRLHYPEWNSTDHQLGFGMNKRFRRWNLAARSNSGVRGLAEVLFTPAVTHPVADAPANFDELLQRAQGGQLSSDEIASVLTGAPVVDSQPKTKFDQGRVLSSSVDVSANYSATPRLSTNVGVSGNHYQTLSSPKVDENVIGLRAVEHATSAAVRGGVDYHLSPGLTVGVNSTGRRSYSSFRDSTSVNTSGTITKRLGREWSVHGGAGMGTVHADRPAANLEELQRAHTSWIVNGGLGYSGREHNVSINGARTLGDTVGLGANVSYNVGANWQFSRIGSPWGLYGRANWYSMSVEGFRNTQGTYAGAGLVRQLSRETSFQAEYSYQRFNSPFRGVVSNLSGHRLQMSWMWRPAGAPR
jgi:hypothetical protein